MNSIVSFSGGKDSTAMLLMMLERGEPIHSVVFFNTGWEFPGMLDHIKRVEDYTGIEIVRLRHKKSFLYEMTKQPVKKQSGPNKGEVYRIGHCWPAPLRRWCTQRKIGAQDRYRKKVDGIYQIGFTANEQHRTETKRQRILQEKGWVRYSLIEYGITEQKSLEYCKAKGFNWGGLYDHFKRVSCFCCPLQGVNSCRILRKNFPKLWTKMLEWDSMIKENRGFNKYETVHDLEFRFSMEEKGYTLKEIKTMRQGQSFLFDSVPHGLRPRK